MNIIDDSCMKGKKMKKFIKKNDILIKYNLE